MGVTVLHQAVGDVAGFKDAFVVAFFCKRVHCPGNHLNSLWRPVPHVLSARKRDAVRGRLALPYWRQTMLSYNGGLVLHQYRIKNDSVSSFATCHLFVFQYCKQAKATVFFPFETKLSIWHKIKIQIEKIEALNNKTACGKKLSEQPYTTLNGTYWLTHTVLTPCSHISRMVIPRDIGASCNTYWDTKFFCMRKAETPHSRHKKLCRLQSRMTSIIIYK